MTVREFDCIMSLGTNCEIAYSLRSYFGELRTGLLDWFITPLAALPNLIRSRFHLVDDRFTESLRHVQVNNTDSIMHVPTGILLHHAFLRDEGNWIAPGWTDGIGKVAEKYRFLGKRMDEMLSASRRPVLFINRTGWYDPMDVAVLEETHRPEIYLTIINAFREAYPHADPTFCIVNGHAPAVGVVAGRSDVRVATVSNHGDWHEGVQDHYAGCKRGWHEALDTIMETRESRA